MENYFHKFVIVMNDSDHIEELKFMINLGFQSSRHLLKDNYSLINCPLSSTSKLNEEQSNVVTEEDFRHLWRLVEVKDGGPPWTKMMDRSTKTMDYQAWRRDPKVGLPYLYYIQQCFAMEPTNLLMMVTLICKYEVLINRGV